MKAGPARSRWMRTGSSPGPAARSAMWLPLAQEGWAWRQVQHQLAAGLPVGQTKGWGHYRKSDGCRQSVRVRLCRGDGSAKRPRWGCGGPFYITFFKPAGHAARLRIGYLCHALNWFGSKLMRWIVLAMAVMLASCANPNGNTAFMLWQGYVTGYQRGIDSYQPYSSPTYCTTSIPPANNSGQTQFARTICY